jgi:hypothetical protein
MPPSTVATAERHETSAAVNSTKQRVTAATRSNTRR